MILFMCEEYVLKLLQTCLFFTLYITTINHHYNLQKEIMLYKTIEIIPYWIFHLPLLHGIRHQQNSTYKLRNYSQYQYQQQPSGYQVNKQYKNTEQQKFMKFGHLPSTSKMVARHVLLNDDSVATTTNQPHAKYTEFESYNKDLSKVYHHSKNLSIYYLPNQTSMMKTISGYEVHRDCYLNTDGRQEVPCILNPYPLYEMIRKFPNVDIHKLYHSSEISLSQPFSHKQKLIKMLLTYETGENAYLPCHTLGAEDSETIIWEKGQNPLFVSTVSFMQDSRFRLNISDENYFNSETNHFNMKTKYFKEYNEKSILKGNKLSYQNYLDKYNFKNNWKRRRWDLIIDFVTPTDSDIYTCMLMGRTSQMISYHVIVNESASRINYSRKRLITISSPTLITIGSAFNLTCSVYVTKDKSVNIAIDWFRPTYLIETSSIRPTILVNPQVLNNILSMQSDLNSHNSKYSNISNIVGELAYSFQQITSRSSVGITIYKQVTGELNYNYRSEVLLTVQSARENDGGIYECRVYEAANYGQEKIIDRAFLDIIIRKRYPHNSFEQIEVNTKLRKLLSIFWKLNPSQKNYDNLHDQHAQNDVASRVRAKYGTQNISQEKDHELKSVDIINKFFSKENEVKFNLVETQNPRMRARTIKNSNSYLCVSQIFLYFSIILQIILAVK
ncbi:hypothetical protein MS3_00007853 [Schistosoma haematobium]|uniref:Ig-like domain-containing protein n=2 Tax=Schistosoma haematobium TaxID=6185 RepID=A0A922LGR3_SCHHA|nr:hypothetical protein MS3_00007853 [Schistosoma haematobium]KAH9583473.1 hypothetical protein MS3_00007853 [Schistosoma haematobium]